MFCSYVRLLEGNIIRSWPCQVDCNYRLAISYIHGSGNMTSWISHCRSYHISKFATLSCDSCKLGDIRLWSWKFDLMHQIKILVKLGGSYPSSSVQSVCHPRCWEFVMSILWGRCQQQKIGIETAEGLVSPTMNSWNSTKNPSGTSGLKKGNTNTTTVHFKQTITCKLW